MIKYIIRNYNIILPFGISSSLSFIIRFNLTVIYHCFLTLGKRYSLYILANIISFSKVLTYLGVTGWNLKAGDKYVVLLE